jgi:hypothetical protein
MKRHLLCLTVDSDPDGLSGKVTNRQTLRWDGLEHLRQFPEELNDFAGKLGRVPITWFVRADGQLESILGSAAYLLEAYDDFWTKVKRAGDELGWHPHLYRQESASDPAVLITDPQQAPDELERLWSTLKRNFRATAFRNGEGWHIPETFDTVEQLGFRCDSTAIPGRRGNNGHPTNWESAPNQPYFPASEDLSRSGPGRSMVELPMNTWHLKAPDDEAPKTRYMNPAVHSHLFANALKNWENACKVLPGDLYVWVMIFHPDEVLATQGPDALYARSIPELCNNLVSITEGLRRLGDEFEWVTVSEAAERWRRNQQRRIA